MMQSNLTTDGCPSPPQPPRSPVVSKPLPRHYAEIIILIGLAALSGCNLLLMSVSLATLGDPQSVAMLIGGAAGLFCVATTAVMIWRRNRTHPISKTMLTSWALWFVGTGFLAMIVFGVSSSNSNQITEENIDAVKNTLQAVIVIPDEDGNLSEEDVNTVQETLRSEGILAEDELSTRDLETVGKILQGTEVSSSELNSDPGVIVGMCGFPGIMLAALGGWLYWRERKRDKQDNLTETQLTRFNKQKQAKEYRISISRLLKSKELPGYLTNTSLVLDQKLAEWENHLQKLVNRLEQIEANSLIQRDLVEIPRKITLLQQQLAVETDTVLHKEITETLSSLQRQLTLLENLSQVMRRTELDIDETLSRIGLIYIQLQTLQASDIDNSRAERLMADISEQSNRLGDLLLAVDEVYGAPEAAGRN